MTNTNTKTKMKADYISLTPPKQWNYWIPIFLLGVFVYVAYVGNIYHTNMNVITAPSVAAAMTTTLLRGGDGSGNGNGNGNGGQEDLSCSFVIGPDGPCRAHSGNEKACNGQRGCHWYPHFRSGTCSGCSGVSCGAHRAPHCEVCGIFDGDFKGEPYCNGQCEWYDGDWWAAGWKNAGCYDK
mmetsp:Transcript_15793/g.17718  ORF Transcript_15793/g.17718 Transcript_15793/m.17718 type:complete len:182 (-) Transcript_15793:48-593(-)